MSDLLERIGQAIDRSLTSTGGDPPQVEVLEEFAKWLEEEGKECTGKTRVDYLEIADELRAMCEAGKNSSE